MTQAIDKKTVTRVAISKIQQERNPNSIKAQHLTGYDNPNKISIKGNNEEFMPDIAAEYNNSTNVYEIELNDSMPFYKWRLFSLYARKNKGNLYLIVPDYLLEPIKKEIKGRGINAGVLYFETK